ncbi:unnamed protein product [Durusdinium trenchii]|uniref:Transmembrane protein n=2 Tax=Durusdinium trenchii TaxID=1381693 RepID=A0ABP0LPU5_9DINO
MLRLVLWLVAATAITGQIEGDGSLVRRHEQEASNGMDPSIPTSSLSQVRVDAFGEVRMSRSSKQDRLWLEHSKGDALQVPSPAVPSTASVADADDAAQPPAPSPLVAAEVFVASEPRPEKASDIAVEATGSGLGELETDRRDRKGDRPPHRPHSHRIRHRLTVTTLSVCMCCSGILGLVVVWRQGKVLMNKPRRTEDFQEDFQDQVAKVLKRSTRSSQSSIRKDVIDSGQRPQAAEAAAAVSQASSSMEAPANSSETVALEKQSTVDPTEMHDTEADAAGGGIRKSAK